MHTRYKVKCVPHKHSMTLTGQYVLGLGKQGKKAHLIHVTLSYLGKHAEWKGYHSNNQ